MLNNDTLKFLYTLYDEDTAIAIRTYKDQNLFLKNIVKEGGKIRCNCCGGFFNEEEIYVRQKYRDAICKDCRVFMKTLPLKEIKKYEGLLFYKNKRGHGVHLSINGGLRDKDCTKVYAHFFELDEGTFDEQMEKIKKLCKNHPPTMIVQTRKSYHVYFKIVDGDIKKFRNIQERLANYMGADSQKINESTCMRMPGFYHNKKEPIMVKLIEHHPEIVYTQKELDKWLPKLPEKPRENLNFNVITLSGNFKDDALRMFHSHVRDYIYKETSHKYILRCIIPSHKDRSPSAVLFKDSLFYCCKGCGEKMSLYQLAKQMGWYDICDAYKIFYKEEYKKLEG